MGLGHQEVREGLDRQDQGDQDHQELQEGPDPLVPQEDLGGHQEGHQGDLGDLLPQLHARGLAGTKSPLC